MAAIDSPQRVVVSDAGPIIHLDELGCLDILADFAEVLIPPLVWQEIERHRPTALENSCVVLRQMPVSADLTESLQSLGRRLSLHRGELQALQLATEQHADLILTDDAAARVAASNLGFPIHGTIGLMLRAFRRRQKSRTEIVELLQRIPTHSTLHLKRSLLEHVIFLAQSEPEHSDLNPGDTTS